ncbi:MAG: hypothetical protein SP1CHLAM42_05840 [Chlamydiales bacterium]|nr:hypothetical protein [Chlamydiales bacterium]
MLMATVQPINLSTRSIKCRYLRNDIVGIHSLVFTIITAIHIFKGIDNPVTV